MATAVGAKITKDTTLSSTTLFVRNLPFSFDNKELENLFSEVGPVKRCFVVKDKGRLGQILVKTMKAERSKKVEQ